ncbi:energy-coupling factor transporter transmembrane component T family protein [Clostridium manihotivorum]|uniref:Cobalamin biosynthesis protein CbiQ n=1 Tax=Clostridium manihotivorum TaxID=2320868 RepID=A0A3R5U4S7_9CLOT|nr:energy-coupling factor transporter transmembrane component T [Clostridium manihotivorum]QAA31577.1 cobalamin biosynthesis protein CbiQ [Clostridium manihotivorum]
MNRSGSLYIEKNSIFHKLDGSVKLLMMIIWTIFIFMFMDARVFLIMLIIGFGFILIAKLPFKSIAPLIVFIFIFTIFNSLLLFIVTPAYGSTLAGKYTALVNFHGYKLTYETLFYAITLSLKYLSIIPLTIIFIFTTHPSKFASSLNRVGISYKVAYAVNIALRYIPDVKDEVKNIVNAQQARGIAFKKGDAPFYKILKNYTIILFPLIISSLNRIEVVSNAMELRGFGINKKRTWYNRENLRSLDIIFIILFVLLLVIGLILKKNIFTHFWYPW